MATGPVIRSMPELQEALRKKVRETDQTLRQIYDKTGIATSRLTDFKNGKFNFPLDKLNLLANHFGVKFRIENWTPKKENHGGK